MRDAIPSSHGVHSCVVFFVCAVWVTAFLAPSPCCKIESYLRFTRARFPLRPRRSLSPRRQMSLWSVPLPPSAGGDVCERVVIGCDIGTLISLSLSRKQSPPFWSGYLSNDSQTVCGALADLGWRITAITALAASLHFCPVWAMWSRQSLAQCSAGWSVQRNQWLCFIESEDITLIIF